jgi:glutamate--cysteine ligase
MGYNRIKAEITTSSHPLETIDSEAASTWINSQLAGHEPMFYTSVDIRNSGIKIAPVDTNLFPAGFNNLAPDCLKNGGLEAAKYFAAYHQSLKKIGLLVENFSRNLMYWDNVSALKKIFQGAGIDTKIVVDSPDFPESVTAQNGEQIEVHQLAKIQSELDGLILNRDFTSEPSELISNFTKPIIPSPNMGWHKRRKTNHFTAYNQIAEEFASNFGFDPWLISTYHRKCGKVDFRSMTGLECVAIYIEETLNKIRAKYQEYEIQDEPYVFVKSDSGTFGMGIMTIKSPNEILELNKKERNKMDHIRDGVHNTEVIIQEGVPTIDIIDGKPAEPFVYMIGGNPIGGIMRINENRDKYGNLNSAGASFESIKCEALTASCGKTPIGIISRLAHLAALKEEN